MDSPPTLRVPWQGLLKYAALAISAAFVLTGCTGVPAKGEKRARKQLQAIDKALASSAGNAQPLLETNATLHALLTYAMLNQPKVHAAYYDYAAAVQRITTARSLPDPRLSLELDIQDAVMTMMPGLMADLPWVKRLALAAEEATSESEARYFAFEAAVLQAAYDVKKPYYQLQFLEDRVRINREALNLLREVEENARARVQAGRGNLQDVIRSQIERERLSTEVENLEDSRAPLVAQLKGALGMRDQKDPVLASGYEPTTLDLTANQLLARAIERNPRLKTMEAEVRTAEVGIRMAHQSRLPDFSLGVEADVKASPAMWRPSLGVTLPIWRDKIAAEIAAAQANHNAAKARLSAEQIQIAVEFADKRFMFNESTRNVKLLADSLLPKARQSLEVARVGYVSGSIAFIDLLDAERSLLDFQLAQVDAQTRRELALAELSLIIADIPPANAPILPDGSIRGASNARASSGDRAHRTDS